MYGCIKVNNNLKYRGVYMLATDKISGAFRAIVEEAEKLQESPSATDVAAGIKTIISIAKHQSDIRDTKPQGCGCAHSKK